TEHQKARMTIQSFSCMALVDGEKVRCLILNIGVVSMTLKDRKSTRLNSSHVSISYAVFCLKKKKKHSRLNRKLRNRAVHPADKTKRYIGLLGPSSYRGERGSRQVTESDVTYRSSLRCLLTT